MADSVIDSAVETGSNMMPRGVDSRGDMPEGFMEKLDQMNMTLRELLTVTKAAQGKHSEPEREEGKAESSHQGSRKGVAANDSTVMKELSWCIDRRNCDRLLEMVDDHAELFLQVEGPTTCTTALHAAVLEGSQTLVEKLLEKLNTVKSVDEKTLHDFCKRVDKWYKVSAWAMAAVSGEFEIVKSFSTHVPGLTSWYTEEKCRGAAMTPKALVEVRQLFKRELEKEVFRKFDTPFFWDGQSLEFLGQEPVEMTGYDRASGYEFFFHQLLGNQNLWYWMRNPGVTREEILKQIICEAAAENLSLVGPVLNLQDGRGQTVLHILAAQAVESYTDDFIREVIQYFPDLNLNAVDFSGRTPLHIASALGRAGVVKLLVENPTSNVNATFSFKSAGVADTLLSDNSLQSFYTCTCDVTALHLAVIHNHVEVVQALLDAPTTRDDRPLDINANSWRQDTNGWTPFRMAASKGHVQIIQLLVKDPRLCDVGLKISPCIEKYNKPPFDIPALHIATASFQPWAVKALVESEHINTFATDEEGNTALHYATEYAGSPIESLDNLLDYVSLKHLGERPDFIPRKEIDQDIIACMDILMQSGLQMQTKNKKGDASTLSAPSPQGVQKWWLEKMAKETQETKNNLINAANAVSVTAALVATASFVGPLQPPLGMSANSNQPWLDGYSQVNHLPVQVFLFCNNLSFYLAIASIVTAMLPSWPIPNEGLLQEVRIVRRAVQVGVLLLFTSIIFVICAFSAASIAIMPEGKWQYKALAVVSTIMGGLTCFFILLLSLLRLLKLITSHSIVAKRVSDVADSILLWTPSRGVSPTPKPNLCCPNACSGSEQIRKLP